MSDHFTFEDFNLSDKTLKCLTELGYINPTKIQLKGLPVCLTNKDAIIQAKTGSGKTLVYLIPLIENLSKMTALHGLEAIILVPTAELAYQVCQVLNSLLRYHLNIKFLSIVGGKTSDGKKTEKFGVMKANILISTTGRFLELCDKVINKFSNIQYLIIDEADYLLEKTFIDEVEDILSYIPKKRITWLFSATQNSSVEQLEKLSLKEPVKIGLYNTNIIALPKNLTQLYVIVPLSNKLQFLWNIIEIQKASKIIVFISTQKEVLFIYRLFKALNQSCEVFQLRSSMRLDKRISTVETFRKQTQSCVLFATDVASRGLDIPDVDLIIQYDVPRELDYYIHRAGRTARHENRGLSILMIMPSEIEFLKLLSDKGIELKKNSSKVFNKKKISNISEKASVLYAKDTDFYNIAKSAFLGFVNDYGTRPLRLQSEQNERDIFTLDKLPIDDYAKSMGFTSTPNVENIMIKVRNNKSVKLSTTPSTKQSKIKVATLDDSDSDSEEISQCRNAKNSKKNRKQNEFGDNKNRNSYVSKKRKNENEIIPPFMNLDVMENENKQNMEDTDDADSNDENVKKEDVKPSSLIEETENSTSIKKPKKKKRKLENKKDLDNESDQPNDVHIKKHKKHKRKNED